MFEDDPLWYKDAIIYQLHVKCFSDSNDDGYGDFRGLTERLDYIHALGVTCIWLLPFYPSPLRDDGYDIADYLSVHPDYGCMRDFRAFVRQAHRLGLKVITEVVINHTSDQHPWFVAARNAPAGSAKRDYYVWSDSDKKLAGTRIIFTDTESSNWAWDPTAGAYYWHRFFSHQPDLNHNNPRVVKAVTRVMRFWLDAGVDGLRLDAIPYLCVREGTNNENLPETHDVIRRIRADLDAHYRDRMLLAEANQWPEDVREYFGDGDECQMAFHFPLMPRIYMAVAQQDRQPIIEIMGQTPEIPETCQWAIFLRNHDELTLEMVTDRERDYMYQTYAADPRMRRNVGICRRLAPLMDNDRARVELLNSLLLSFPGTPIIYYGDELGMGDNIYLGDRDGVRTPMQWSVDRNAGFSRADPAQLYLPVIMNPVYGYQAVNVEAQARSASSLLNWMKRLIAVRKAHRAFGRGAIRFLHPRNAKILAYLRELDGEILLCVANLCPSAQPVELDLQEFHGRIPVELMGQTAFPRVGELPYLLTLPGHGFYWFSLCPEGEALPYEDLQAPAEIPFWVLTGGWGTIQQGLDRLGALLPGWIDAQRWFGGKGAAIEGLELSTELCAGAEGEWLLCLARVQLAGAQAQEYFIPLALAWGDAADAVLQEHPGAVVAKVRQGHRTGALHDAYFDPGFCRLLLDLIRGGGELPLGPGARIKGSPTSSFPPDLSEQEPQRARSLGVEQSHTSVRLGDRLILKGYRRLPQSPCPELEIGRHLTEVARFPNIPPVAGSVELHREEGPDLAVALLQGFAPNKGDGWSVTLDHLERHLERSLEPDADDDGLPAHLALMHTLGLRTGQLHHALSLQTGDPAFDPEPVTVEHLGRWRANVRADAERTLGELAQRREALPEALQDEVALLLAQEALIQQQIEALCPDRLAGGFCRTRFHGDYHLGQVLVTQHDIQIIDFEGEQPRPGAARVRKHSPLRDVAGMLRSFNYAASSALQSFAGGQPADRAALEPVARRWEREVAAAFLSSYGEGIAGCCAYPDDPAAARDLIELFVLEKALYEINYEINHRPGWVSIPVRGILSSLRKRGSSSDERV
jgi:maltose alpha-D-glucosyltransferase / alpha-amylase